MPPRLESSRQGDILLLTLSHPEKKNALSPSMLEAFIEILASERSLPTPPRVAVIASTGEIFSAGYDLNALPPFLEDGPLPDDLVERAMAAIEEAPFPFIAALNGPALGAGCDLACSCDLRVAARASKFVLPPARLGIVYSMRGLARFSALLGVSRATELFLVGSPLSAERAYEIGLVHQLVEKPEEALPAALALASTIAKNAPLAVRGMRRALRLLARGGFSVEEEAELEALRRKSFGSDDAKEGVRAFFEKRPPDFRGR